MIYAAMLYHDWLYILAKEQFIPIVGEEDALFLTGIFLFDVVKDFLQRCCGFLIGESKIPNDNLVRYTGLYTGILETGETAVGRNIFFGR